jgi:arginine/lysine/ornithine decarboxylase
MTKIAINRCFGGFGLSNEAFEALLQRKGIQFEKVDSEYKSLGIMNYYKAGHAGDDEHYLSPYEFCSDRSDSDLIAVIEEMGATANGSYSELKIVEIPDDVKWEINEYDGYEHVAEVHRTWC